MRLNKKGVDLLHKFEGLRLEAYKCPAGVWTIGYGNTYYEDGSQVKLGDKISRERAEKLFTSIANDFAEGVKKTLTKELNENQFSALVSFAYNVGFFNFRKSTLLRKVNDNPNDQTISKEFMRWVNAGGKPLEGLRRRREAESKLYYEK